MTHLLNAQDTLVLRDASSPEQLLQDVIGLTPQRPARADGIAIGTFDGMGDDGCALVSIAAFGLHRISARCMTTLGAVQSGQSLALGFEAGDPMRPIVIGVLLDAPGRPAAVPSVQAAVLPTDILLDGEHVVLTAREQIELRCGDAALILSADGRIELRGTYITSQASATQRILGGAVNIN